jgi:hypothetical protein
MLKLCRALVSVLTATCSVQQAQISPGTAFMMAWGNLGVRSHKPYVATTPSSGDRPAETVTLRDTPAS